MTAAHDGRLSFFLSGFADRPVPVLAPDLIYGLLRYLSAGATTTRTRLCSGTLCGVSQRDAWTCGYRNIQMLLSSAIGQPEFGDRVAGQFDRRLPSVPRLQELIEQAWRQGFDTDGARHFNYRLRGSRQWIGTTEVAVLLRSLEIRCHLVDCDRPGLGRAILRRLGQYYSRGGPDDCGPVAMTSLPAVYFQYDGHSVTVAGVEFDADWQPMALLIVDPGRVQYDRVAPTRYDQQHLDGLRQCQMLFIDGVGWQSPLQRQQCMVLQSTRLTNT